jgi:hypothetical protein
MAGSALSFYFFDFDDNVMFLSTPIFILNTLTREIHKLSTGEFADVYSELGIPGKWANYSMFDGSYRHFRDLAGEEAKPGRKQYFVEDIESAIGADEKWKGPSWKLFTYACAKQRPVSIVTARGHSRETIRAGIRVLRNRGLIEREPNYHTIYPVGNDDVRRELGDTKLDMTTPALKRLAILRPVDCAMERYGREPMHRFGMSDDDPKNVSLIIRAMCDCKKKYLDKRFLVIDTHLGEEVKLEVFPVNYAVTGHYDADAPGEAVR